MRQSGFTLVELVVAMGIVGLLAAIAIPNFNRYQMRAKVSEAATNLQAVANSQQIYFAEFGSYVSISTPVPAAIPGGARASWPSGSNFDVIGWAPEGASISTTQSTPTAREVAAACCATRRKPPRTPTTAALRASSGT